MATILITGASSGIGKEIAEIAARNGEELVLVSRHFGRLEELSVALREKYTAKVHVLVKDLSLASAPQEVLGWCDEKGLKVDYLVNNAGFGDLAPFAEADPRKLEEMIAVNITALTLLTRLFLAGMVERGGGRILNISSLAAFQPGPLMAVYYATKSFVLNFSEALRIELEGTGVTVTTLCPGPTASRFKEAANMTESRLMNSGKIPSSAEVAACGYRAMMKGKAVVVHGGLNNFFAFTSRFTPRDWAARIARYLNSNA